MWCGAQGRTPGGAQARLGMLTRGIRGLHLRPSLALVFGHQARVWPVPLEPPAQSFFKGGLRFGISFRMTRTRHELAPAMPIQQAIDAGEMHLVLHLRFKGALYFLPRGNFSL